MRLKGKAAIVVGAGQTPGDTIGNGRATAILMAREGADVFLVDRDETSVRETAMMIGRDGGTAEWVVADWTDAEACHAYARSCLDAFGRVDCLHNSVGVLTDDGTPSRVTEQAIDHLFQVNLKGALLSCQAVLPQMRAQQSGSIVQISSAAAELASASFMTAYRLSKASLNTLGQALAATNAKYGIRVNTIAPGLMDTPHAIAADAKRLDAASWEAARQRRNDLVPLRGGMGDAWDVAWASVFLHSDEAKFITGVLLPVDGGQSAVKT